MTGFMNSVKFVGCALVLALALGGGVSADDASPVLSYTATLQNGDIDASGMIDITDPLLLVQFLYLGGAEPAPAACQITSVYAPDFSYVYGPTDLENGDINGDGFRDLSDFIAMVDWQFAGGEPPVPFTCTPPAPASSGS